MKHQKAILISAFVITLSSAIMLGSHLARSPLTSRQAVAVQSDAIPAAAGAPAAAVSEMRTITTENVSVAESLQEAVNSETSSSSPDDLRRAMNEAVNLADKTSYAETLATLNSEAAVQSLLDGIGAEKEWATRAALAKHLRAVSDPDTLPALVPALMNNYGRGNTILNEIVDGIARMAQPDTVEALATLHWQTSTQAGQGHKVLKAVAAIGNPPAMRGLARLAERAESPALAAAAQEALKRFQQ
jgi:HEAT repeat protein